MSWFKHDKQGDGFVAAGKAVQCPHCGSAEFFKTEAQLHTQGLTFFELEWLGRTVHALICAHCSCITWFGQEPENAPSP